MPLRSIQALSSQATPDLRAHSVAVTLTWQADRPPGAEPFWVVLPALAQVREGHGLAPVAVGCGG